MPAKKNAPEVPDDVVSYTPLGGSRTEVVTGSGAKLVLDLHADRVEEVLRARGCQITMAGDR